MKTRLLILLPLAFGGCASASAPAPAARAIPDYCKTAYETAPSYAQVDISARIAERRAALPEGAAVAPLTIIDRPAPQYPRCATSYGVEGHCDMVFDVTADGRTANILPVCTSRLFERDSEAAVRRWTFAPPGDGPRPAVLNRLTFKLQDSYAAPAPPAPQPQSVTE